jgi:glycosyltransferase involved in cell wall biosynthesis
VRILIDAHLFDNNVHQGTRTYIRGLYNELIVLCPEIDFYFACSTTAYIKAEIIERPNVHFAKFISKNKYLRLSFELPLMVLRYKIDFAHYQYISPLIKLSKNILTIHDLLFLEYPIYFPLKYRLVNNLLFKRSQRSADILLTVSEYSKSSIVKNYGVDKDKVFITANGVNPEIKNTSDSEIHLKFKQKFNIDKYILYVSRIEPRKNHINLLKAFVDLNLWAEGYKLVFVGKKSIPVPELNSFQETLPEKISSSIIYFESVSNADLALFYSNCSLFVFPSYAEGFGIPPLEALLLGANVLCSNQTAMKEFTFLKDRLFNPHDSDKMKLLMRKALDVGPTEEELTASRDFILSNYTWKNSAEILRSKINANRHQ